MSQPSTQIDDDYEEQVVQSGSLYATAVDADPATAAGPAAAAAADSLPMASTTPHEDDEPEYAQSESGSVLSTTSTDSDYAPKLAKKHKRKNGMI